MSSHSCSSRKHIALLLLFIQSSGPLFSGKLDKPVSHSNGGSSSKDFPVGTDSILSHPHSPIRFL